MPQKNLYIVDNCSEDQSVKRYLSEWCPIAKQMDIATGYLEIGGLLALDHEWQKLDKIRIILGSEVTKRTKDVLDTYVKFILSSLSSSIDKEQERNEFLVGIPAIFAALKNKKIECRVFDKNKFHAKAYITYFRDEYKTQFPASMNVPLGYALVGSSNLTKAGLTQNIELNVQVKNDVDELQAWFEKYWQEAEDISSAILEVIETYVKEFKPYDVYIRSMYEYFKSREETVTEWENNDSAVYRILSKYQRDGYRSLIQIAEKYTGAFLCDGVGLGKTFIGMMLIERFVKKERKNVVLIVPASARESVWESTIKKYMPEIFEGFYPFKIINHTDLLLDSKQDLLDQISKYGEIVIIDEAHNFRNRSSNRYRKLFDMMRQGTEKKMFMLTATPINNSFLDLQHLIELFTHEADDFFAQAPLGIHSLKGHFKKMESKLSALSGTAVQDSITITDDIFREDQLVNQLVVQRSRSYVKKSLSIGEGEQVMFSSRQAPTVANYSLRKAYGKLIDDFVRSFYRKDEGGKTVPILALAVYSPYENDYFIGDKSKLDAMKLGRQSQIVNLIRQLLLKRFESSIAAFQETCLRIYIRLRKFLVDYIDCDRKREIQRLFAMQSDVISYVEDFISSNMDSSIDELEDDLPAYVWDIDENCLELSEFNINAMVGDTILDMEVLADFFRDMMGFSAESDDKLTELKRILREDLRIHNKKVIIFTEYRSTAMYIYNELKKAGFKGLDEVDGRSVAKRSAYIKRFAPYYNDSSSSEVDNEISILIATDVLAEGINLQDAQCLVNYELHWNPVKLMQRIGRVDRRRNADIEARLLMDHPELAADRTNAYYWNFLPPAELEQLLSLYQAVSRKTMRISKTFGIEGKKLLTPDDDYEALKDFNSQYEGKASAEEEMELAYQELIMNNPEYLNVLASFPKKIFSGRISSTLKGFFFCYELPSQKVDGTWSEGDGIYKWYLLDNITGRINENSYDAWKVIT